jgi:hypothetical protein
MSVHGQRETDPNYEKTYAYEVIGEGDEIGSTAYADTLREIAEASTRPGVRIGDVDEGFFAFEPENGNRKAWRSRGKVRRSRWERLMDRPMMLGQARKELELVLDRLADEGFSVAGAQDGSLRIVIDGKAALIAPRILQPRQGPST